VSEENKLNIDLSTNTDQKQDNQKPAFQIPTEAAELVGDGKKYQSVEDALKSVPHAQKHIQTLESELAAARDELAKRKTAEELLDEIKSGIQPKNDIPSAEISQDKLLEVVNQTLEAKERQRTAQQNARSVAEKFTEKYGDKAEEMYKTLARESGLSEQQLNELSARSPGAVIKLAGFVTTQPNIPSRPSSTVNTESLKANSNPAELSARVKQGATTKDLVNAWKIAGEKVKQQNLTN
jgi:hypothetical protein